MAVQLIQATTIKKSNEPIPPQEGYHVKKIKYWYYLIKTTTIEINYKQQNKKP